MSEGPDTIDLADVLRSLARGWKVILASVAIGGLAALLVILFAPRKFEGQASAIVRSAPEGAGSLLARVGAGEGAGGAAASALLGGGLTTPLETEIQILSSRAVTGAVVDSLFLQVEPRDPDDRPATAFVRAARLPGSFKKITVRFTREGDHYRVEGDAPTTTALPGGEVKLPVGTLVLRESTPKAFTLRIYDRDEAIKRASKSMSVGKAGGEVLRVGFRAPDSITAAAVPNAVLANYLTRRKGSDRGVNAYRAEFLRGQVDSVGLQLATAEEALRRFQERSGVIDAQAMGKLGLERAADLRKDAGLLQVEEGALDQLLEQVSTGRATARQLAAYPSFLKSPGINELLKQLAELETERTRLLERRLETDDEVVALSRSIANIEGQLVPLGRAYAASLKRQRSDVDAQLGALTSALSAFPAEFQSSARLVREVVRLSQIYSILQTQLVQARLSAIAEGGDVRSLDVATPPRKVAFPQPALTAGMGLGAGLVIGLFLAVLAGSHGRYLQDAHAIERAAGVPALRFDPRLPLLMSGRMLTRTVLLIPLEASAGTERVAERLVDTALARGEQATVLDLSGSSAPIHGSSIAEMIGRLEKDHALVVVRLPGLSADATAALLSDARPVLLVAPPGRVNRGTLAGVMATLRRLDVPCAGIVLSAGDAHALASG